MRNKILALLLLLFVLLPSALAVTYQGDNFQVIGVNHTEDVFVQHSTNATFTNCTFSGDFTTTNSTGVDATYNYWLTAYAPLGGSDGCPDGDGGNISTDVLVAPWYRAFPLSDLSSNCKPSLQVIPNQEGNIGYLWSHTANCTDVNLNDSLVYSDNTSLFVINPSSGYMSYTPPGIIDEQIKVTCSDSEYLVNTDFRLSVESGSGYIPVFTANAIADVTIDTIVDIGITIFGFTALIAVVIIWRRAWKDD